jgi:cell division protein FtsW (lipid II flippase)
MEFIMNLIVELIKYLMILLIGVYTYYSFSVFRVKKNKYQKEIYRTLTIILFILHFVGYFTLYIQSLDIHLVYLYGGEVLLFIMILVLYQVIYPRLSRLLLRNMLMLLSIGFIIQTRLSYDMAVKQLVIVAAAMLFCLIVPWLISRITWVRRFGWFYGIAGVVILAVVLIIGTTNYGATNWLYLFGVSIQPSEFVKLLFVISLAAILKETMSFRYICIVTGLAGLTVIILVLQRDLGGALIFFVTYIFMLYVVTARPLFLFSGLLGGSIAALAAYRLFSHVRVRYLAWTNPFAYIDKEGYQITQSLFAIGTGGWFGMGLNRGLPTTIPVVDSDFIFSAISEELGALFAICIILIYFSCFVMFINVALRQEDYFYRNTAIGLSVMFIFQVFLSIGGVTKFIPSTGVTLPFISKGGSSMLSVIIMFMIIQGIYVAGKSKNSSSENSEKGATNMADGGLI